MFQGLHVTVRTQMLFSVATGDPKSFKINVAPQADFPIDLYILMDLTVTLQDALIAVGNSVGDICE